MDIQCTEVDICLIEQASMKDTKTMTLRLYAHSVVTLHAGMHAANSADQTTHLTNLEPLHVWVDWLYANIIYLLYPQEHAELWSGGIQICRKVSTSVLSHSDWGCTLPWDLFLASDCTAFSAKNNGSIYFSSGPFPVLCWLEWPLWSPSIFLWTSPSLQYFHMIR